MHSGKSKSVWGLIGSIGVLLQMFLTVTIYSTSPPRAFAQEQRSSSSVTDSAPDPCELLTSSEIEKVQGEAVADTKLSQQAAGSFSLRACFYRTSTFAKSISLALAVPIPADKEHAGPREFWMKHFHDAASPNGQLADERRSEAKKEEAEREVDPVKVPGLGEQAYWIANPRVGTLYVLQENYFLRISLGGKDNDDARANKARNLARAALRRLKASRTAS